MNTDEIKHFLFLANIEGLGTIRIKRLIEKFKSAVNIFNSSIDELASVENISPKTAKSILKSYENFNDEISEIEKYLEKAEKLNIRILTLSDEDYPVLLKKIYDPPVILYIKGNYKPELLNNAVSIVGTRKPTDYGKAIAEKFAVELSSLGIAVISGFARGIDTIAHKAVINNKNSQAVTAAVFGCGADIIYPPENHKLYEQIAESGLLISEYKISSLPDAVNFPKRNRIISGLSAGTIVIESNLDGGALITARMALDQEREVFAVPGYITSPQSIGTNYLIKASQAKLVENTDDIIAELPCNLNGNISAVKSLNTLKNIKTPELAGNEKLIYDAFLMTNEALHIDFISEKSGLNISDSLVALLSLEFKGIVEQLPGKRFILKL